MTDDGIQLPGLLRTAEAAAPAESVDVVTEDLRRRFRAETVSFLIVDLTGKAVVRLSTAGSVGSVESGQEADRIDLIGGVYGQVVRTQQLYQDPVARGQRVITPVTHRGDAIGLLELTFPTAPDDQVLHAVREAARALAYIVIVNQRFTDLYTWGKRTTPISLSAEIQHQLLPPSLTCETAEFTVAGALEPSATISGDTFDYALDREALHLSVTDPMGHDLYAALMSIVLMSALRRARRAGAGLAEQAREADQALLGYGKGHATGQLLRIDMSDGRNQFVNAGHPWPLRVRDGRVEEVTLAADEPFGLPFPHTYQVQSLDLRPGDRLVMLTDGMLERGAEDVVLPDVLRNSRGLHPREAALNLTTAVLDANDGQLEDDATIMVLDWRGTG
ncbi:serine/threonine-protein phosphatase [Streptomyces sp. N2-109]|uniref:Serine/threonine-protein phosphatase n=1 Tax=Streptomyces gossypii TaxID=2883101 RepID=A0ABT2K1Z3_9ACTN|nr:PP2C family protein-serine/threonine phosphatase [Streptomyces gossypii]MCT2594173.1 serine/threonine-protein phosphatase [Streptomyces gossypii]